MSDLGAFLLARYDEEWEAARPRTVGQAGIDWMVCAGPSGKGDCTVGPHVGNDETAWRWQKQNPTLDEVRAHEMTHASAAQIKTMRDIEAKRKVVKLHHDTGRGECYQCLDSWMDETRETFPCPTVRLLAEPYSDHADYDERWRL